MKKKIFCLVLAVLMLVPMICLAGCGESDEEKSATEAADKTTATITMFMITEKHVPTDAELKALAAEYGEKSPEYKDAADVKEAYDRVASELNKITKKSRTQLVTYFYTREEYAAVEEMLQQQLEVAEMRKMIKDLLKKYKSEKKKAGITDPIVAERMFYSENPQYLAYATPETEEGEVVVEETVLNEYNIQELKYPELQPGQVDIVCIEGYDKYIEYINNGWLSQLDSVLSSSFQSIPKAINEKFLDAAKVKNKIYGIPTNKAIGEYTFLLINKELFDRYQYHIDDVTELTSEHFIEFLEDIALYCDDIAPITGELDMNGIYYWNLEYEYKRSYAETFESGETYYVLEDGKYVRTTDEEPQEDVKYYVVEGVKRNNDAFSLLGSAAGARADESSYIPAGNIFEDENYVAQLKTIIDIKEKRYYNADAIKEDNFASAIIRGGAELAASYADDYYIVNLDYPHTDNEELCANLIGVSSGTVNLSRSMDVIALLTTNEEFRNILQYGIENIDYKIDKETSQIVRTSGDYMMNINVTGNVFMAYPEEEEPANRWTYAKLQNLDSLYTPLSNFTFDANKIDFTVMDEIKALSVQYKERLDACETVDELEAFIKTAKEELAKNEIFVKGTTLVTAEGELASLNKVYTDWYNATYKK